MATDKQHVQPSDAPMVDEILAHHAMVPRVDALVAQATKWDKNEEARACKEDVTRKLVREAVRVTVMFAGRDDTAVGWRRGIWHAVFSMSLRGDLTDDARETAAWCLRGLSNDAAQVAMLEAALEVEAD